MSEKIPYPCTNCKHVDVCNTPQCARWRKWFKATWREETKPFRELSEKVREKRGEKQKGDAIPEGQQESPNSEETTPK